MKLLTKNRIKSIVEKEPHTVRQEQEEIASDRDEIVFDVDVKHENVGNHGERVEEIAAEIDHTIEDGELRE